MLFPKRINSWSNSLIKNGAKLNPENWETIVLAFNKILKSCKGKPPINILLNKVEDGLKKAIEALEDILDAWKSLKNIS